MVTSPQTGGFRILRDQHSFLTVGIPFQFYDSPMENENDESAPCSFVNTEPLTEEFNCSVAKRIQTLSSWSKISILLRRFI